MTLTENYDRMGLRLVKADILLYNSHFRNYGAVINRNLRALPANSDLSQELFPETGESKYHNKGA